MRTRVCRLHAKGDIRVETEPVPPPGAGEVLVAIGAGGICGSDLHYFQDGGFGPVRVRSRSFWGTKRRARSSPSGRAGRRA
jgi:L-idonate 5-dehydrogenase